MYADRQRGLIVIDDLYPGLQILHLFSGRAAVAECRILFPRHDHLITTVFQYRLQFFSNQQINILFQCACCPNFPGIKASMSWQRGQTEKSAAEDRALLRLYKISFSHLYLENLLFTLLRRKPSVLISFLL